MQADKMKVNKIKVATLTGALLDYWAAKADDKEVLIAGGMAQILYRTAPNGDELYQVYSPSTDWSQGGLIIENEKIKLEPIYSGTEWKFVEWRAKSLLYRFEMSGPTALIAAMRFCVANNFGEEVDEV